MAEEGSYGTVDPFGGGGDRAADDRSEEGDPFVEEPRELEVEVEPEYVFSGHGTTRASLGPRYGPEITDEEFAEWYRRGLASEKGPKGTGRRVSALQMAWGRGFWLQQGERMEQMSREAPDQKSKKAAREFLEAVKPKK